jgi:hypothetical protein
MIASETTPHTALVTPVTSKSVVRFMDTADASCSSNVDQIFRRTPASTSKEPTELQCATLLLSVADIVSKEIDAEGIDWEDDISDPPPLSLGDTENIYSRIVANSPDAEAESRTRTSITAMDVLSRARSVSLDMCDDDSSQERSHKRGCSAASSKSGAAVISPIHSPVTRRNPRRTSKIKALLLNTRSEMPTRKYVEAKGTRTGPVKTILRKKFSWKNYPEVGCPRHHTICIQYPRFTHFCLKSHATTCSSNSWRHFSLQIVKNTYAIPLSITPFSKSTTTTSSPNDSWNWLPTTGMYLTTKHSRSSRSEIAFAVTSSPTCNPRKNEGS